jgi:hypothetical protein
MRKFSLLLFILAIGIYWSCKQEVTMDLPKETSFYIVGDWGRMGQYAQTSIAKQMDKSAKLTPIDFIFSTGDNFYENGVADINDAHWKQSYEQVYSGSNILKTGISRLAIMITWVILRHSLIMLKSISDGFCLIDITLLCVKWPITTMSDLWLLIPLQ